MYDLHRIGISAEDAYLSVRNVGECKYNRGITYSNYATRDSVMVIGVANNIGESINTWVHEIIHLATQHIATALGITDHEELAYLGGEIARDIYNASYGRL